MPTGSYLSTVLLPAFLALGGELAAQEQQREPAGPPSLRAYLLDGGSEIHLDGLLDEPVWRAADLVNGFRQREPDEGAPASEDTEVRVLYDGGYLYIGVRAFDSQPDRIVARRLERDAPLGLARFGPSGGDDAIEIILDAFHDRRNAYYFATNPRGVQVDGLITDESERPDLNWDAVWDVRARVTPEGWTAEFAIPLRTLRFPAGAGEQTWGFNVQRTIARKTEQSLWTAWSRDNEGLARVSRAGELTGLKSLAGGVALYVKPYLVAETGQDYAARPGGDVAFDPSVGLDAKLGLESGLVLDLTVNTDFAQVEADDEQVDLTRFNLFFPEKREFFLENAGIFEFGAPQFFGPPNILLFFSRRIGLQRTGFAEAQTVPMIGGARLTGRAGGQTVGVLNVVTGEKASLDAPVTNFAVGRIKRDIGQRSYIGAIVTHRLEEGGASNLTGGVDWNLWLSNPLVLEGFYARVRDSQLDIGDYTWQVALDYTGDWIGGRVEHLEIGPDMSPGIGFVRRLDMARTMAGLRLSPRPPISGLRKIDIFNRLEYVSSVESRALRDRIWELSVTPRLDSGDQVRLQVRYQFQRLANPFELTPGVIVPAGDYADWNFTAGINTSRARPVSARLSAGAGGFWDGDRRQLNGTLIFDSPHVGLELGYSHNNVDVPGGAFTTDLVRGRVKLALNTRLFGNALIQYNSQTGALSANLRVDWIHRPGSDLFVVFNERRDVVGGRWNPRSRAFVVKLTYLRWL
jgi:hypothetical protein